MMTDTYAPAADPKILVLSRLIGQATSDALFALAGGASLDVLDAVSKRRGEAYETILVGQPVHTMLESFDGWVVEMSRALAPISPPVFLPMGEVLAEKVTLEIGARGLRGLFSSKPSEKDVQRVRSYGSLATRVLRLVLSADGALDVEEKRAVAAFIAALGLPESDAVALHSEPQVQVSQLEVHGELEPAVARAIVRGAWLASAWDAIDPREEEVVRTVGRKVAVQPADVEALRTEAVTRVDARRAAGLATIEAARYILSDRVPGSAVPLIVQLGTLMLPRRYRDEALAHVAHWTPIQLSGRHRELPGEEKALVLSIAWLLALYEDPSISRRALLRARHDRFAQDLGDEGARVRSQLDPWLAEVLAPAAFPMTTDAK
jgi:hypothetical protein